MGSSKSAGQSNAAAIQTQRRMMENLDRIDLPDIEKMRIQLESPELMEQQALQSEGTAFDEISLDPRIREAQMEALRQTAELGETGLRAEDLAAVRLLTRDIGGQTADRQDQILQQMADAGLQDSGLQISSLLENSAGSAEADTRAMIQQAQQNLVNRRGALSSTASQATGLRGQDYGDQLQQARARDVIQDFNVGLQRQKQAERQLYADMSTSSANEQQIYNKALEQQKFQNELSKAGAQGQVSANLSSILQQQANAKKAAAQSQGSFIGSTLGTVGGAVAGSMVGGPAGLSLGASVGGSVGGGLGGVVSDRNEKENIFKPSTEEVMGGVEDMLENLTPYKYNYKNPEYGEGEQIGIMAQDLEKSDLGQQFVSQAGGEGGQEDAVNLDAPKVIEYGNMQGTQLAGLAALYDKLKGLEKKVSKKKDK